MRYVADRYGLGGEQRPRKYRQRSVLRARNHHFAFERLTALYLQLVQVLSARLLLPLFGGERPYRQRMNFISDQPTQRAINQLMTCQRTLALELRRNDRCLEVSIVVADNFNHRAIETRFYQSFNLAWIHNF